MVDELRGEFPNEIIRASAGTGKTFRLSNRYLRLLASGAECQTILATTFTRKGAGEILDRIMQRLSDAALCEKSAARLAGEIDFVLTCDRAAKILYDLIGNLHRLEISTLDSFFNRVAKTFALELGLPPTWEIVEEQEIRILEDDAIQSVLRNESVLNLLHMLSKGEASRRVASMVRDTVRNVYDIYRESGPGPWDQLERTGQRLSTDELDRLVAEMEAVEFDKIQLPRHWNDTVMPPTRNRDWAELATVKSIQNVLDGIPKFGNSKLPANVIQIYNKLIPHLTAFLTDRLIRQNHSTRDLLESFGKLLEKRKDETGALRFDDVTERLQQFVAMWHTERFAFRLDHQIQHLLLDEFQDTSLAQWNVIRPFANAVTENPDHLRSFFCVGDMKQAIFGWRGGVAEIFDLVDDELPNLEDADKLTASYRSAPPIIDVVNKVFGGIGNYQCGDEVVEQAIAQWGEWFEPHSTNRADLPGYFAIEMAEDCDASQKQKDYRKDWLRNKSMIKRTVNRVKALTRTLPEHHDVGVIVRTNQEVQQIIGELMLQGVPASEEGGTSITDSAAVDLILSVLTLADHPGDSIARFHLSHSPLANQLGLQPESLENQSENQVAANRAAATIRSDLISFGYGSVVESLARVLIDDCTERETLRIQHLVQVAYDSPLTSDQWELRPSQFVDFVRNEFRVSDQSASRVRVMTIHKAKGLEFDVVVLPIKINSQGWSGMTPNVVVGRQNPTEPIEIATRYANKQHRKFLPKKFQQLFDENRQANVRESMCVSYVALTRAVHACHVVVSFGAKPDHQSTAGLMLSSLCPDKREPGLIYELGDKTWYEKTEPTADEILPTFSEFYLPEELNLGTAKLTRDIRSGRGISKRTPSSLEGGDIIQLGSVFQQYDLRETLVRGRLVHGCFELVQWLDESIPAMDHLEEQLQSIDPTASHYDRVIAEFYAMLDRPNLRQLLERSTYSENYLMEFSDGQTAMEANRLAVHNEFPFATMLDNEVVQGIVDRLILVYQGDEVIAADLIDFKADSISQNNLQERIEFYRPQMATYRMAISKVLGIPSDRISTRIVFVDADMIINLELADQKVASPQKKGSGKGKSYRRHSGSTTNRPAKGRTQTPNPTSRENEQKKTPHSNQSPDGKRQQTLWD